MPSTTLHLYFLQHSLLLSRTATTFWVIYAELVNSSHTNSQAKSLGYQAIALMYPYQMPKTQITTVASG